MPTDTWDGPKEERADIAGDRSRKGVEGLGSTADDGYGAVGGERKETEGVDYLLRFLVSQDELILRQGGNLHR